MLIDNFGRILRNLRISVTHECNYHCVYCHMEGWGVYRHKEFLNANEIRSIAEIAMELGINEFKITGGEPLVRRDIIEIVSSIASLKPKDLSMTTNGYFLHILAEKLVEAGLKRINVSIPSLSREKYRYITGIDSLEIVLDGIKKALDVGLTPLTINIVVLKNINDDEYLEFIKFASRFNGNIKIRFIELEPITIPRNIFSKYYISLETIEKYIESIAVKKYIRDIHARPVYVLYNGIEIELVRWLGNRQFCRNCNRIRLSADGILKPCILARNGIDLKPFLRPTINRDGLREAFFKINALRHPYII
ncbi:Radical SAM domain protein [Ignisphaera aggregans DSM 17230]|uniref:Probable GTP 3',8-cyclase n=1 Tax=Ignisphaera aggregans (strain DSM 17230 / JCM 13409 / AQ1.S1) TaxID=583356 RepID=E0SSP1_IGNAA|nr:Radical SAM domain protein [Ignisphaera aggregans DSM 17230]